MMHSRHWWDVAVGGLAGVMAVICFAVETPAGLFDIVAAVASLGLVLAAYLAFARPVVSKSGAVPGDRRWRAIGFVAVTAIALGIGVAAFPDLAILQCVAYPLAWLVVPGRPWPVVASACLALAVFAGFVVGFDFATQGWVQGVIVAVLSFTFAIGLGLWITSIEEYGQERNRLVAELTAAQAQVEVLSRERGAVAERERLARDIHDTLAQTLAGLVMLAERAGVQARGGRTEAATATIATVEQVAREALGEARSLVARTAAVPGETAFDAALERFVERFRAEAGLTIDLELTHTAAVVDRETQVVLLRCLQEILANVRKHAAATLVLVRVTVTDEATRLFVRDDGRGFDSRAARTGFGIDGMTERVALAGGTLEVSSAVGAGTQVQVDLPPVRTAMGTATAGGAG